jgi:hypothetical protein
MPLPRDNEELIALLQRLGVPPEEARSWAGGDIEASTSYFLAWLFTRQAWSRVLSSDDHRWITAELERKRPLPDPDEADIGPALERCLERGVDPADLTAIARAKQADLLFSLCYLLGDASLSEPELRDVNWTLVLSDENFEPTDRTICGMHELVTSADPEAPYR